MQKIVAGVDVGGTHVTVCLTDVSKGELINHSMVRTHVDPSMKKSDIIDAWANAIRESFSKTGFPVSRVGIAMPGPFDYEKGISYIKDLHKFEHLYGENVKELLATNLGIQTNNITMLNDASAFLMGEISCGAGAGYQNLAGITLGTGLGSASFFDNKIYEGELYKMPYKDGCAEDYISARWLIDNYEKYSNTRLPGVKMIADRYHEDECCQKVFTDFGENLGKVLISFFSAQSPEVIIIGGNIALAWDCFIPSVTETLEKNGASFFLKQARLGEKSALIGASHSGK